MDARLVEEPEAAPGELAAALGVLQVVLGG
jgi:hypothetical protein